MAAPDHNITELLQEWSDGSGEAFDRLVGIVYDDLSRIAHRQLGGERPGHTLDTQALVHESYLNLVDRPGESWRNRAQFFAVASKAMRRVLIDYARRRNAQRRGGGAAPVTWTDRQGAIDRDLDELLAIDEALRRLSERDERMGRVVECRFFGGMTVEETAEALDTSPRTVERDWTRARAYLFRDLVQDDEAQEG